MPELKIGDEFLKILSDNTFYGMDGGDVTDHIAKVLKITEWIKIPNVNKNELRLHVFSKSLSEDAEEWWNHEINGTDTTWNELDWEYSLIPIPAPRDISNPDELCKTEEFIVIKYSMGSSEEFVTVSPSKVSTVERTPGS
ncbi:hypothetical protein Tco_0851199, partial [Tanacetum coccineum]